MKEQNSFLFFITHFAIALINILVSLCSILGMAVFFTDLWNTPMPINITVGFILYFSTLVFNYIWFKYIMNTPSDFSF